MLTVDFDRLALAPGARVLDLGCGNGRHTYEALRRGAQVVALDRSRDDLVAVSEMVGAMVLEGQIQGPQGRVAVEGDALGLPFPDESFDRVIAAEILEHVPDDHTAMAEIARVLRPGGLAAVTVPRWLPERICWVLSRAYHEVEGGHIRIYTRTQLVDRLTAVGLEPVASHHAHALHSPYWWLKCAVGVDRDHPLPRAYHRMLVWDIMRRPWLTRTAERLLDPLIGKSFVVYLRKPAEPAVAAP